MIRELRAYDPKPGCRFGQGSRVEAVVPDVFVRRTDHGWAVEINAATLPRVRLNQGYASLIGRNASHASRNEIARNARTPSVSAAMTGRRRTGAPLWRFVSPSGAGRRRPTAGPTFVRSGPRATD